MLTVVSFLAMLMVVIIAHELGHFVTAKLSGVKVEEFGIFYPPRLFSVMRGGTRYSFNALPLGGFVKMAGEEDPSAPGSLASKSIATRLLVLGSGSLMNLLLPALLLTIAFMLPFDILKEQVFVREVATGSPAEAAGIVPGDIFVSIGGQTINSDFDVQRSFYVNLGSQVDILVRHEDGSEELVRVSPRWKSPEGEGAIGTVRTFSSSLLVESVAPDSPASGAGIRVGDTILTINGNQVRNDKDLDAYVGTNLGEVIVVSLQHADSSREEVRLTPRADPPEGQGAMGLEISWPDRTTIRQQYSLWEAIPRASRRGVEILILFKNGIVGMVSGALEVDLRGPVGIAQMTGQVARAGIVPLLEFAALISINLGLINLFPIPALDGGRIAFVLVEFFRRGKRISPKKEWIIHTAGFVLLIGFLLVITFRDIVRITGGGDMIP